MPHRTDTPFARATFIIYHIETLDNDLLSDVSLIYLHVCTGPYSRKLSSGNSGSARQAHCRHRPGQPLPRREVSAGPRARRGMRQARRRRRRERMMHVHVQLNVQPIGCFLLSRVR